MQPCVSLRGLDGGGLYAVMLSKRAVIQTILDDNYRCRARCLAPGQYRVCVIVVASV